MSFRRLILPFLVATVTVLGLRVCAQLLAHLTGTTPRWPIVLVPLIALIAIGVVVIRRHRPLDWPRLLPPLLCLSLLLGPYGWLYDQTALVVCQGDIVIRWWWNRHDVRLRLGVCGLVIIQLLAFALGAGTDATQDAFTWLPLAMLAVWSFTASAGDAVTSSCRTTLIPR